MEARGERGVTDYYGLPTRSVSNAHLRLDYLAEAGPRLVRLLALKAARPENLLAETPEAAWPTPYGDYRLYGGHRLWHAPEGAPRSSIPDSTGLQVENCPGGVRLLRPAEPATGIAKTLEVRLDADGPALTLVHALRNDSLWAVELAPWAITQLRLGGVAVLPQPGGLADAAGLLPNRHFAVWPYTSLRDPRLELGDDLWLVHGRGQLPPCKIGYENRAGWAAYILGEVMLVKRFWPQPGRPHADFGSNVEVYVNDINLELEVLGPLRRLEPGETAWQVERWELYTGLSGGADAGHIRQNLQAVGAHLAPLSEAEVKGILV